MSRKAPSSFHSLSILSHRLRLWLLPVLLWLASPAQADNAALLKLFEILKAKGSITQEEYDQLVAVARTSGSQETAGTVPEGGVISEPVKAPAPVVVEESRLARIERRLEDSELEMRELDARIAASRRALAELDHLSADSPQELMEKMLDGKWYESLSLRGYVQFRYHGILGSNDPALHVPNDRSVSDYESFFIRRGRVILSGDVSDHLFLYAQSDYNASNGSGDFVLQMRDLYADISLDPAKEFRFRVGQSKVPFGWVNMQSSQNRAPLERPDAINSAAEGERDVGAYFYWAPKEKRALFRQLIKDGLKGSGDYGVFGIGAYSGQGPNRGDLNGQPHYVARFNWPLELDNGQIMELGVQAYTGSFVVGTQNIPGFGTPAVAARGVKDERAGLSYILYPQPFGIEAEWLWGRGPQLARDFRSISSESLSGGYVQANWRQKTSRGVFQPFVRWNQFEGGRKFARNAPASQVREMDAGIEWSPVPEIEITLMYSHTFERTNTALAPYDMVENANRIGLQLQWNF